MEDMYREMILDHYRNPRQKGLVSPADIDYEEDNPVCGDHIHLTVQLDENDVVTAVGWEGEGCAISQASASLLYESLIGKSKEEIRSLGKDHILEMLGSFLTSFSGLMSTLWMVCNRPFALTSAQAPRIREVLSQRSPKSTIIYGSCLPVSGNSIAINAAIKWVGAMPKAWWNR